MINSYCGGVRGHEVILRGLVIGCVIGITALAASPGSIAPSRSIAPPTFNKDVLPILQKNCQECHRPGEIAPMSLLTYAEARPWAKGIKAAVLSRKMPPWFASDGYAHFANDKRLPDADIATLAAWADHGAPEGDAQDQPTPRSFESGWNIKPDMIIEMPQDFHVHAIVPGMTLFGRLGKWVNSIDYKNILVKANFAQDTWVVAAEVRPGNRAVVHHIRVDVRSPGQHWMEKAVPGVAYESNDEVMAGNWEGENLLGKYNPGLGPQDFSTEGAAKFVPKGSDIVFQIHYTAIGKDATDRSKVGLVFAKKPPVTRYFTANWPMATNLVIPAGDGNAEVVGEVTVATDNVRLVYVQPHMHLRGKDYELRLIYPTGEVQTVFKGKWDFNWQQGFTFAAPIPLPKGTRLVGISHFDNSLNNPFNPDAKVEVVWGDQNWDEMSAAFLGLLLPIDANPQEVVKRSGVSLLKPVPGKAGPTLSAVVMPGRK